jgi:hypothetical protein
MEAGMSGKVFGHLFVLATGLVLLAAPAAHGAEPPPLAGCYERVYDNAHLAAHKGQMVVHARLVIDAGDFPSDSGEVRPMIAAANLTMWVRGAKQSFYSSGACWAEGKGLLCNGSLSAAEMDGCKTKADGVHDCRIYWPEAAGRFRISPRPSGVVVNIPGKLELSETDSDSGPFLYLSHSNTENHDFLLKSAPASACK